MKNLKKFKSLYQIFIKPKKTWQRPNKADVLIYDQEGSNFLVSYIPNHSYSILNVRGESINVQCLVKSIFEKKFWIESAFESYIYTYVKMVNPSVVITLIDNDSRFYKISSNCVNTKTIFVQNGRRTKQDDIFGIIETNLDYNVDYMLVAGEIIGRKYQEYVRGRIVPIGFIKNNEVLNSDKIDFDKVLFISSWEKRNSSNPTVTKLMDGTPVTWEDFYEVENHVLKHLDNWCFKNNRTLQICGKSSDPASGEQDFYKERIKKCKLEFLERYGDRSTYEYLSTAFLVVFIDSTVGYESLCRGKRTAAFMNRVIGEPDDSENFGWPATLQKKGPFWTNSNSESEYERILNFLDSVSEKDWDIELHQLNEQILVFDPGNQKLRALLEDLLPNTLRI